MVVVGVTAIVSSLTLNQKKTTSSRASTYSCETNGNKCVFKDDIMNPLTVCQENGYTTTAVGSCAANHACCKVSSSTPSKTPTPIPSCLKRTCLSGMADDYYAKSGKYYEDSACLTPIPNLTNFCKGNISPPPANTATPVPPSGKGCGSGGGWECDVSKGYDTQSCPVANKEFRCCVQRSNGELVVYGCGGTHCSAINLSGITACSTQAGYGSGAPGSLITKPGQANPTEPPAGGGGGGAGGPIDPNCKAGSGNRFECDPSAGYNTAVCTESNMEFACCVQDTRCPSGEARYRWYGCTGQPCQNTKIGNAIGHLVACPYGVDKSNQESCESALPPTPTFPPAEEPEEPGAEPTTPPFGEMGECVPVACPAGTVGGPYYQMLKQRGSHASDNKYYETLSDCNKGKTSSSYGSFVKTTIQNKVCKEDDGRGVELTATPKPQTAFATLTPVPVSSYSEDQRIKAYCRTNNNSTIVCSPSKARYIGGIKYCCDFDPSDETSFNNWVKTHPTPTSFNVPGGGTDADNFDLNDYTCTGFVNDQCRKSLDSICWSWFEGGQYVRCKKNNDSVYQGFCCPTEQQINANNEIGIQMYNQCSYDVKLSAGGKSATAEPNFDAYVQLDMRDVDESKLLLKFTNTKTGDMRTMTVDASTGYYYVDVTGPGCP